MVRRVARAVAAGACAIALTLTALTLATATGASAQSSPAGVQAEIGKAPWQAEYQASALKQVPTQLSSDCRVKEPAFVGKAPLKRLRRALIERRPVKVLAIGSSSTVGIGASSPLMAYPVRLESNLEAFIKGADVQMIIRGVGGEVATGAAERLKLEIADIRPDLVVWQVGTNDAMARLDEDDFSELLRTTLSWLRKNKVDVVLIDPQYTDRLAGDDHYRSIVKVIDEVASTEKVLLVRRFDAMADLARQRGASQLLASDGLHLNDLGYRCMAEYAARAIVAGILQADLEPAEPQPKAAVQ
ncbi:MAG: SGNH/GDSL hydrolase family protein [Hyphomicrobiaceae bacterium]|nr:SGNH/GDSL hydrolase family protein [Hyphomicrobiaceae bacterium]